MSDVQELGHRRRNFSTNCPRAVPPTDGAQLDFVRALSLRCASPTRTAPHPSRAAPHRDTMAASRVAAVVLGTTLLATSASAQSYYGVSTMLSQTEAQAACVVDGNNLASMHTDADHLLVMDACNAVSATGNCWIGLSDSVEEGTWAWTDGTTVDYENWNAGEPVSFASGRPHSWLLSCTDARFANRPGAILC
jgi:hypothetical protein